MKECYHQECDVPASFPDLKSSLKLLSGVTQALILSVFELTMPPSESDFLKKCSNADLSAVLTSTTTTENYKNDIENDTSIVKETGSFEKDYETQSEVLMHVKNYQPNHEGMQINIENFHVNEVKVDNFGISKSDKNSGTNNQDLALLMEHENPLGQIISRYFSKTRTNSKKMKNSPMMIKLIKKEL